ncbi:unnamed protein product [Trifolium pratense]|uniref:Uncharacterized protein n=1 Tax=Trifolium pratense TaxID=57577 RepID=A0ACB0IX63_TRIPR|nr:unnamed protein product [Trifolium pratense]
MACLELFYKTLESYVISEPEVEHVDSGGGEGVHSAGNTLGSKKDVSAVVVGVSAHISVHDEDVTSVWGANNDAVMEQVHGGC